MITHAAPRQTEVIGAALEESIAVKRALLARDLALIGAIASTIAAAFRAGGKVLIFGNGGSAAEAQHVAAEFVGRFRLDRAPLPAIALSTDTSIVTSVGNDFGFDAVFARQVEALAQPGDVAIALSTSGRSANVVAGASAARRRGATLIGMTGSDGGALRELVDLCLCVPSESTARVQEANLTVWHAICDLVEAELFAA